MVWQAALFSFHGRLRRLHWWVLSLFVGLVACLAKVIVLLSSSFAEEPVYSLSPDHPTAFAIGTVIDVVMTGSLLSLSARRAHDLDLSAAPFVALGVFNLATGYARYPGYDVGLPPLLLIAGLFASVAAFFILGFLDGARGPNRHGPSPKGARADEAARSAR